jgi:hypothetical protein
MEPEWREVCTLAIKATITSIEFLHLETCTLITMQWFLLHNPL